ncbi:hypothetical protein [Kitasatospora sp. NPDC015120]|uniref:hypothetical protein n=1 Tax=Kitasatospora sp. NPDC015120 TaxID=3364023 RepID=UPI0036F482E5
MPDFGGGLARTAVTGAFVAGAAFGLAAPSHTSAPEAPAPAAPGIHHLGGATTTPVHHPPTDRQNQGH